MSFDTIQRCFNLWLDMLSKFDITSLVDPTNVTELENELHHLYFRFLSVDDQFISTTNVTDGYSALVNLINNYKQNTFSFPLPTTTPTIPTPTIPTTRVPASSFESFDINDYFRRRNRSNNLFGRRNNILF